MYLYQTKKQALLADVYNDDPSALMQSYVTNQGNNNSIVNALAAIPYLTPSSLINAGELHLSWYHSVTLYQQILKYQRIYLASHVIYGSSRLGTKDYLPGQLYSLVDYQQAQPVIDTSILNGRRPWYSGQFNDDIEPGATTVWGNTQTGPFLASERIGEKQYELSNHLGNVQATVSDNRYEVADKSTDSIIARHPALRSAYDYYPFGMLMPGRYVSDTCQHCVTVTRPTWVWKWVISNCHDVYGWVWYNYLKVGRGTATKVDDAILVDLPSASDGVSFDISVTPHVAQQLQIDVKSLTMSDGGYIQLLEQNGEGWKKIAEVPVNSGESMVIPFTPNGNVVRVAFWGAMRVYLYTICNARQEWVEENQLVTICDGDKDKYRFGYNGIEKVNEMEGVGNHYQALYGDYSSRTGFRWNLDPKATPGISPYAMFRANPIWFNDPQLDDPLKRAYRYARKMGLKDEDFRYVAMNGKSDPESIHHDEPLYLEWGSTANGTATINDKLFKMNFWDKVGHVFAKGDELVKPGSAVNRAVYNFGRFNPLVQGVTSLWSSVFGRDISMKSFDDIQKTGDNVSGAPLSGTQRAIEGGKAVSNFVGLGLGGGTGFATDLGVNGVSEWAEKKTNKGGTAIGIKTAVGILQFYQEIRKKPMNATLGATNSLLGISLDAASKEIEKKNSEKSK